VGHALSDYVSQVEIPKKNLSFEIRRFRGEILGHLAMISDSTGAVSMQFAADVFATNTKTGKKFPVEQIYFIVSS
jgi:hypothetical protein